MEYNFAIKKCTEALVQLTTEDDIETRIRNTFNEVSSLDKEDVSIENLQAVVEWCEKYLSIRETGLKVDGTVEFVSDKNREFGKLAHQITYLCIKIIEDTCGNLKSK
ncbi:MAG: hypothetical protein V4556_14125 [Bacteroidota bacterium]